VTLADKLSEARRRISSSDSLLTQRFWAGEDVETIVRSRAWSRATVGKTTEVAKTPSSNSRPEKRIAASESRCHRDFLDQAREDLPALRILTTLAMLDVGPFRMARHTMLSWCR